MDPFLLLRFAHSGSCSCRLALLVCSAPTVTFIAVFHDGLLVPGALAYSVLTNVRFTRAP